MHVVFLNPQGNFDETDAHMTEHPDFGGQLIYVKEICMALAEMGTKVDIVTRLIDDPEWSEFSEEIDHYTGYEANLRIVRIRCGGEKFLRKEDLWEHMDEFTDNILAFYGHDLPEFATTHYGDGGYCGVLLRRKAGIGFTFTGHSLGAQKLDKLGMDLDNYREMDDHFFFRKRIQAERLSMEHAYQIITSTSQERMEQYAHPLYHSAVDPEDSEKFSVIPPGVNDDIFHAGEGPEDEWVNQYLRTLCGERSRPFVIASSRLDEKKNHIGLLRAYVTSSGLQAIADLAIFIRGVEDPFSDVSGLPEQDQAIVQEMLELISEANIKDKVFFANLSSQQELASAYRFFARLGSVFALTAFHEPFGLAPIEAAACGLAVVATKDGGPSEIFKNDTGVLIDPSDPDDIARGLVVGLDRFGYYSERGRELVQARYTWDRTAESYLNVITEGVKQSFETGFAVPALDASERLLKYLKHRQT